MTLQVYSLSGTRPSDLKLVPRIAQIHCAAWLTIPLMRTIYYGAKDAQASITQKYVEQHTHSLLHEPACQIVVVIDDALPDDIVPEAEDDARPSGKVIAALKYYVVPGNGPHPDTGTQEVIDNPDQPLHESAYENVTLSNVFVGAMVSARMKLMKTLGNHLLIDQVFTDPAHHRRGAGGLLMRHACQKTDELGLPAMLEASPAGMKVYEAVGFKRLPGAEAEIWVDLERWTRGEDKGQEFEDERFEKDPARNNGWYAQMVMVRPANAASDAGQMPQAAGENEAIVV